MVVRGEVVVRGEAVFVGGMVAVSDVVGGAAAGRHHGGGGSRWRWCDGAAAVVGRRGLTATVAVMGAVPPTPPRPPLLRGRVVTSNSDDWVAS